MRQLEKYVISGVRYIVWDEMAGEMPETAGCMRLMDAGDGIGGDRLVVIDGRNAKDVRVFDAKGRETVLDDVARYAAALCFGKQGQAMQAASLLNAMERSSRVSLAETEPEHCEVRLTECFCRGILGKTLCSASVLAG